MRSRRHRYALLKELRMALSDVEVIVQSPKVRMVLVPIFKAQTSSLSSRLNCRNDDLDPTGLLRRQYVKLHYTI